MLGEKQSPKNPFSDIEGPVLDSDLDSICQTCYKSVLKGKMPLLALANGKWIGKIPPQLLDLSFAEQLLVARVRWRWPEWKMQKCMNTNARS